MSDDEDKLHELERVRDAVTQPHAGWIALLVIGAVAAFAAAVRACFAS